MILKSDIAKAKAECKRFMDAVKELEAVDDVSGKLVARVKRASSDLSETLVNIRKK